MNFGIHYEEVIIFKGFNEDTGEVITDKYKEPWEIIEVCEGYFLAKNIKDEIKAFPK